MSRDDDLELIQERLLLRGRRHHSSEPDLATVGRRQDNVRALQRGEERQRFHRCETCSPAVERMFQRHPERVPKKSHQQMRFRAPLELMEDGTESRAICSENVPAQKMSLDYPLCASQAA